MIALPRGLGRYTKFFASPFLAVALIGGSPATHAQDKVRANGETIRIQNYPSTISTGVPIMWVAKDKGFCAAHNLNCVLIDIPSAPLGLQAVASNSIEINQAATDALIQASARGLDVKLLASPNPSMIWTLAAHKDIPLPNKAKGYPDVMQDLRGKKIGVTARGSASEIFVRALLQGAGMKISDVTIVAVGAASTAYQALAARQVDAHMGFEPFQTLCLATKLCNHVVDTRKGEGPKEIAALNGAYGSISARASYIEKHPVVIDAFMQVLEESVKWMRDPNNFEEMFALTRKYVSLGDIPDSEQILRDLLKAQLRRVDYTVDRKAVQATADFLLKNELLTKPFDINTLVHTKAISPN